MTAPPRSYARPALGASAASRHDPDQAFHDRLARILVEIDLPSQFRVILDRDQEVPRGRFYFQIEAVRLDVVTGQSGVGRGGKAYLSRHATDSELVQTVWGLYDAYCHHEARETFLWRGRRVFGPHIDVEAHWEVAERTDARPTPDRAPARVPATDVHQLVVDLRRNADAYDGQADAQARAASVNGVVGDGGAWMTLEKATACRDAADIVESDSDPTRTLLERVRELRGQAHARRGEWAEATRWGDSGAHHIESIAAIYEDAYERLTGHAKVA